MLTIKIITGIVCFLIVFVLWCCCKVAGESDRQMEEYWNKKDNDVDIKKIHNGRWN